MENNDFFKLSENEVKKLNGSTSEESFEAWRAGYIYLAKKVRNSFEDDYHEEFMQKMEDIAMNDLDEVNMSKYYD